MWRRDGWAGGRPDAAAQNITHTVSLVARMHEQRERERERERERGRERRREGEREREGVT